MEAAPQDSPASASEVAMMIKNPGRNAPDFQLKLSRSSTVADVKARLAEAYAGTPPPATQTLIYAGKVLKDEGARLQDLLKQAPAASTPPPVPPRLAPANQAPAPARDEPSGALPDWHQAAQQQQQADAAPRNPFEGNPALALAYNAALTAIESSGPGPGAPPFVGSQAPLLPPMPHNPYLLQQPLLYLPAYSLVPQQPGVDGQPAPPRFAPVMAPMMPMMPLPFGMEYGHGSAAGHLAPPYGPTPTWPQLMAEWEEVTARLRPGYPGADAAGGAAPGAGGGPLGGPHGGGGGGGAAAAAAQRAARPRNGRPLVRVRLVRINLRSLLQLAVLGVILYQHCPPGRFALVATVGLTLYLTGLAPLRRLLRRLASLVPALHMPLQPGPPGAGDPPVARPPNAPPGPPRNAGAGGAAEAPAPDVFGVGPGGGPGGAPGAEDRAGAHGPAPLQALAQRGLVHELQALLIGFFTSLLPGFNVNPEDAVAFAAAQQAAAAEVAREAAGAGGGGGGGGFGGGGGNHAHVD